MGRLFTGVRAVFYASGFILLWGWFVVLVTRLDRVAGRALPAVPGLLAVGITLVVAGGVLALTCAVLFVSRGEGTPAPFDAPKLFVASGPYRFVRNPMYLGALLVLSGFGLFARSPSVLGLVALAALFAHLFVLFVEEPSLSGRFGEGYAAYRRVTNRWVPRVPRPA